VRVAVLTEVGIKVTGCPEDGKRSFHWNVSGLCWQSLRGCSATDGNDVHV